jgi:hypothetical protein
VPEDRDNEQRNGDPETRADGSRELSSAAKDRRRGSYAVATLNWQLPVRL